jgi:hypothetical protein
VIHVPWSVNEHQERIVTLEALDVMSRSDDWGERARAARLVATHASAEADAIVLRLLWDA